MHADNKQRGTGDMQLVLSCSVPLSLSLGLEAFFKLAE